MPRHEIGEALFCLVEKSGSKDQVRDIKICLELIGIRKEKRGKRIRKVTNKRELVNSSNGRLVKS